MKHKKTGGTLAVSVAIFASACGTEAGGGNNPAGSHAGEAINITLAVPVPETGMMDGTNWWADEIEARTNGEVTVEIFYNSSLIPGTETMSAMADGRVDGGWISDAYYPNELPLFQISGIPFDTRNGYANARSLYDQYQVEGSLLAAEFEAQGMHVTHFVPYATTIFATSGPIKSVELLNGSRLRATGTMASVLNDVGAEAVFMEASDIFEAIDRGILDGAAGYPMDVAASSGFGEASAHFTDIGYGEYAATAIAITPEKFASLSPSQQDAINEVSAELQERSGDFLAASELHACERLVDENVTLTTWEQPQSDSFEELVKDKYSAEYRESLESAGLDPQATERFMSDFKTSYEKYKDDGSYSPNISACEGG